MQVHVGRAAHRVGGCDGVLKTLGIHNVPGANVGFDQGVEGLCGGLYLSLDVVMDITCRVVVGWMRSTSRQHHPHRLGDGAHGVGCKHGTASAAAGHHVTFELLEFFCADPVSSHSGTRFSPVKHGQVVALGSPRLKIDATGRTRPRIDH